jgi:hypothetical protein
MAVKAFGKYNALSTATTAQNKSDINANLDAIANLFQTESVANIPVYPDFNKAPQSLATQIKNEITALKALISSSP